MHDDIFCLEQSTALEVRVAPIVSTIVVQPDPAVHCFPKVPAPFYIIAPVRDLLVVSP